jgi:hypothetical protein
MLNAQDILNSNPAHAKQCVLQEAELFSVPDHPIGHTCRISTSKRLFSGTKKSSHSANFYTTIQAAGFLQALPKSSFKKLVLST